jgi:hypothetical protein
MGLVWVVLRQCGVRKSQERGARNPPSGAAPIHMLMD